MPPAMPADLPVNTVLPRLEAVLAAGRAAVLEAPPGAGKSTGVPLALLDTAWLAGRRIVMLEPRRLAARAVATRMADLLGERVGETVGYRLRLDTKVGPRTRIEVVTEGILTRRLQRDPALEGVGLLIFDEFHERSLQADLGLALALDVREHLNPGLRLLVMSATLDGERVARLIGDADVLRASGRSFPVTTRYLGQAAGSRGGPASSRATGPDLIRSVTAAIRRALEQDTGDMLVFLPGSGEIRRVAAGLAAPAGVDVVALYGDLPQAGQDRAIRPAAAGRRKVVLATNIAETSLTIEGVHVVIDGGLERRPLFNPRSGMSRLETVRVSAASADQRRGRAGRLGPGICYRCWDESVQRGLQPHTPPEILEADLAPLALELAAWGIADANALRWLDPPPPGALAQARELLASLGALDAAGRITPHGRGMARLGAHPRLAHLMLNAKSAGLAATGCALAALLSEPDVLHKAHGTDDAEADSDLRTRLELFAGGDTAAKDRRADGQALARVRRTARLFADQLEASAGEKIDVAATGWLLATAWPGRVGRLRPGAGGRYQLSGGRGAFFARPEALAKAELIVVPELDAGEREARIFLAAPVTPAELERHLGGQLASVDRVGWDPKEQAVLARRQRRLGELVLDEKPLADVDPAVVREALLEGVRSLGLHALPWTGTIRQWQARVQLMHRVEEGNGWPDVGDETLLDSLEDWLAPWLDGLSRREHLSRIDLSGALQALLDWNRQRRLDELVPTHVTVPSGSRIALDYLGADAPSLSVRLQEVFGLNETPRVAGGRVPVLMKLLSPARRPVQITRDLASFWATGYQEVRREMKGRYPKHYWPENPREAEPTRRVRPR